MQKNPTAICSFPGGLKKERPTLRRQSAGLLPDSRPPVGTRREDGKIFTKNNGWHTEDGCRDLIKEKKALEL